MRACDNMCVCECVCGFVCVFLCAYSVFCPGFQKGRVPFEKGPFSAVSGPSKGHN